MTAPSGPPAGETAGNSAAERLTWEDRLRLWLIQQDDALATAGAIGSVPDRAW